jgi:multidrug resistance protein, MATE family
VSQAFLLSSIGIGALGIGSALISQANGRGQVADVNRLYRAGLWVALLLGTLLCVVSVAAALNIDWFRQPAAVSVLARPFLLILSVSTLPLLVFMAARQLTDGLRYTSVAMAVTAVAVGLNALFNYVLILGVGPFPKLGLNGSATATLLSRVFMAGAMLAYVHRAGAFRTYLTGPGASLMPEIRRLLRLGLPSGLTFFFEVALFSTATTLVGWLGPDRLAAHQIALSMASVTYMASTGISAAAGIRVGTALGRADYTGIRRAGVAAFILSACVMGVAGLLFLVADETLVGFFLRSEPGQSQANVMHIAASLVFIAAFFQLSDGIQVVGIGVLRGLADVNVPTLITLISYWLIALPTSYVLGFVLHYDAPGVWIGLLVGLSVAALLLTARFFRLANPAMVSVHDAT